MIIVSLPSQEVEVFFKSVQIFAIVDFG